MSNSLTKSSGKDVAKVRGKTGLLSRSHQLSDPALFCLSLLIFVHQRGRCVSLHLITVSIPGSLFLHYPGFSALIRSGPSLRGKWVKIARLTLSRRSSLDDMAHGHSPVVSGHP